MADSRWVRVSTPAGHFSVPRLTAERAGSSWSVLKQDAVDQRGRPLPPKLREEIDAASPARKKAAKKAASKRSPKPRVDSDAATPTTEAETTASGDNEEQA